MTERDIAVVETKLEYLQAAMDSIVASQSAHTEQITKLREEVAGLRVLSGIWGAIAGAIPAVAAVLYTLIR